MVRSALLSSALVALAVGCGTGDNSGDPDAGPAAAGLSPEQASRVVARVGDEKITLGEYATTLDRMDSYDRLRYQTTEKRRELLKEMVDIELLALEAKRRGLDAKPEAQAAIRQILRDALLDEEHKSLPTPTEIPIGEVKEYYEAHIEEYREPEKRRISAIVMEDEAKAKEVLEIVKKDLTPATWGKQFYESSITAAQERQQRISLDLAGELGMVGPPGNDRVANEKVPEPLRVAVFKIEKSGQVYDELVKANGKLYIVRMSGLVEAHERSFAEAEIQIRGLLLRRRLIELERKLEEDLRQKYKVEIDEEALSQVSVPSRSQ